MTRRLLLAVVALGAPLPAEDIHELFGEISQALAAGRVNAAMRRFDKNWDGYERLRVNLEALVHYAETGSSVRLTQQQEEADGRVPVELDWTLELHTRQVRSSPVRKRAVLRAMLLRQGRRWRVLSLEPVSFFTPPPEGAMQ